MLWRSHDADGGGSIVIPGMDVSTKLDESGHYLTILRVFVLALIALLLNFCLRGPAQFY